MLRMALLAVALLAAGCAMRPARIAVVPLEAYRWSAHDARLSYGVPDSDDLVLALDCAGPALTYATGWERLRATQVQLAAGGRELRLAARAERSEADGTIEVTAAPDLVAALAVLEAGGEARVWAGGAAATLTTAGLAEALAGFRAQCPAAR